ncbi:MAG: aldo/keto reductase [Oscillospiraceae bacterium]|nr:aldo/keto reductase [Oscillospiraceae bacterium]
MKTITLSNRAHELSITNLAVGHVGMSSHERRDFITWYFDAYIDAGGNCIDTARIYENGDGEKFVGEWLKTKQRDKIALITKCGHYDINIPNPPHRLAPEELRHDVDTSLRELDVDYIDVLMLHRDDIKRPIEEIMTTMHAFVKTGKTRLLGTSNWTAGRIQAANQFATENGLTPFSVSQIHHSLAQTTAAQSGDVSHVIMDDIEYSWYKDEKFPVMAWSPTARGFFSKLAAGEEIIDKYVHRYGWTQENYRRLERVKTLAAELKVSVGAVVLAYLMCDEDVPTCAVVSFSKKEQYDQAIEAANLHLTNEQRKFLEGI